MNKKKLVMVLTIIMVVFISGVTAEAAVKTTKKNDKVYTTCSVSVRANYSSKTKILGSLKKNTQVKRTGVVNNGWTRISYKGKNAYVLSKYVSTKKPTPTPKSTKKPTPKPLPSNMIDPKHFGSNNTAVRDEAVVSVDSNTLVSLQQYTDYINEKLNEINKLKNIAGRTVTWSADCEELAKQVARGDSNVKDGYQEVLILQGAMDLSNTDGMKYILYSFASSISDYPQYSQIAIVKITFKSIGNTTIDRWELVMH